MKKLISFILAAALLLALTGCSGQSGSGAGGAADASAGGAAQTAASAKLPDPASVTMEEQVLVDEAGIKVTATDLGYHAAVGFPEDDDAYNTYHLAFTLENNTDQTIHPEYSMTGVYNGITDSFSVYPAAEAGSTYADYMGEMNVEPGESRDFVLYTMSPSPDAPVQWAACLAFDTGETEYADNGEEISSAMLYLLTDLTPIKTSATDAAPVPKPDPEKLYGPALYEDDVFAVYAENVSRNISSFPDGTVLDYYIIRYCYQNKTDQWLYAQQDNSVAGTALADEGGSSVSLIAAPQSFGYGGFMIQQEFLDSAGITALDSIASHITVYGADTLPYEGLESVAYLYTLPDDAKALLECDISLDKAWIDAHYTENKSEIGS